MNHSDIATAVRNRIDLSKKKTTIKDKILLVISHDFFVYGIMFMVVFSPWFVESVIVTLVVSVVAMIGAFLLHYFALDIRAHVYESVMIDDFDSKFTDHMYDTLGITFEERRYVLSVMSLSTLFLEYSDKISVYGTGEPNSTI